MNKIPLLWYKITSDQTTIQNRVQIKLRHKLFFTLFLTTGFVAVLITVLLNISISLGFRNYLGEIELRRFDVLVDTLQEHYREHGSWDLLRRDAELWQSMIMRSPPAFMGDHSPPPRKEGFPGSRRAARMSGRLSLYDSSKHPVVGVNHRDGPLRKITLDDKLVGWLGVRPPRQFEDVHQIQFIERQRAYLVVIASVITILALVVSALLARHLLKPVDALAKGTAKLATGNFAVRIRTDSKDELGRLAMDFNSLAQALERAETLRRQWVADISHELRTPLSILRGEVEALQDGVRECSPVTLKSLHAEILHMSKIVDDLYTLALSDIGSLNYAREIIDIEELVQSVVSGFRTKLDNKKIMLRYEPGTEKFVYADRQRLGQLFRNVVENTLRYTDAPGKLVIRTEANKESVVVHFEDSAPGVPETELEHLFERFSRAEMSRNRESGGAGLGLAICRKIAEAHEGEISAQQSELGGLHIKIRLPASSGMA